MTGVLEINTAADIVALSASTDEALIVDGIYKAFGGPSRIPWLGDKDGEAVAALDDVSLRVRKGEIYGVLGANGSGKSTLIRLIATLLLPDRGSISVFGHDVVHEEATVQRMLNRVSVEASLFKKLSAMENLIYAARLYGVNVGQARKDIVSILGSLGISQKRLREPVDKMSRGMQQKVAIARALLTSPVLLLLDEPTTGLDPRSKKDVQRFVLELREKHNATVLLTSHDMAEADALCDRLAILHKGRIVLEGTSQELKDDYVRTHTPVQSASLEDVFMDATGRSLTEDDDEEGGGD